MENKPKQDAGQKKKLLIVGCGRSGTLYSAQAMRVLGLDIRHELERGPEAPVGNDGFASWFLAADDPNPPFGPTAAGFDFELVIHQVRHPLKVIPSVAQFILQQGVYSPDFIKKHAPQTELNAGEFELDPRQQLLLKAARYWYYWNLLAQERAGVTMRVEELKENLSRVGEALRLTFNPEHLDNLSPRTNSRDLFVREQPWQVSWEDLHALDPAIYEKIRELAASYGY